MQKRTNHIANMLKSVLRFVLEHPITPALAVVTQLIAVITATVAAFEAAAEDQTEGDGEASGGVRTKRMKQKQLRAYLKDVARVGRSLDPEDFPGLAATFVLPNSNAYPTLVASAQAMITAATPHEADFVARGLPATFLADLTELLTDFNAGSNAKIDGLQTQVGGTSGLKYQAKKGLEAAQKLDAIIRAHFRNDPVTLDIWTHARHVQLMPVREGDEETPTDGGSDGSGTVALLTGPVESPATAVA